MLADVLRSAADLAPKTEEDGLNDAVIADSIEQVLCFANEKSLMFKGCDLKWTRS